MCKRLKSGLVDMMSGILAVGHPDLRAQFLLVYLLLS